MRRGLGWVRRCLAGSPVGAPGPDVPRCAHTGADTSAAGSVNRHLLGGREPGDTSKVAGREAALGEWGSLGLYDSKQAASALGNMEAPSLPSQKARAAEATSQGLSGMVCWRVNYESDSRLLCEDGQQNWPQCTVTGIKPQPLRLL
jgi:hypothetical protein